MAAVASPEAGSAELLYSQPIARHTILAGKLIGLFLALVAAEAIGFGASGLVLFWRTGRGGVGGFLGVTMKTARRLVRRGGAV